MADDTTSIYLELSGSGLSPQRVRMRTLFGVLGGLEAALEAMAEELGVEFDEHESIITPQMLEESSVGIPTTLNRRAKDALARIDRAFYAEKLETLPSQVRSELRGIQTTLGQRGATLRMRSDKLGLHGFSLTEDTPVLPKSEDESLEMTSHAVVYGVCTRVNRKKNDASIDLHDGQNCKLENLSSEHFQMLMTSAGERPDQVFRVEGQATWEIDDYRITRIEVTSIQTVERDAGELFDNLREATGDEFAAIDPTDYVNQLRGK